MKSIFLRWTLRFTLPFTLFLAILCLFFYFHERDSLLRLQDGPLQLQAFKWKLLGGSLVPGVADPVRGGVKTSEERHVRVGGVKGGAVSAFEECSPRSHRIKGRAGRAAIAVAAQVVRAQGINRY